jgi:hypothetical protein
MVRVRVRRSGSIGERVDDAVQSAFAALPQR